MAKHRAYMKMYWPEFIADTMHLTTTQVGAYTLLVCHYWQHGGLPNDDQQLARITKLAPPHFAKMRPVLAAFFQPGWRHKRIDKELQLTDELHEKRSRAGIIGNARRSQMRSQNDRTATHIKNKNITTTEYVPRAKEADGRGSKGGVSAELVKLVSEKAGKKIHTEES